MSSVVLKVRPAGSPVTLITLSVVPLRTESTFRTTGTPADTATTAPEGVGVPELAVLEKEAETFRTGTVAVEKMDDERLAEAEAEADSKADEDKLADFRADDKLADSEAKADKLEAREAEALAE